MSDTRAPAGAQERCGNLFHHVLGGAYQYCPSCGQTWKHEPKHAPDNRAPAGAQVSRDALVAAVERIARRIVNTLPAFEVGDEIDVARGIARGVVNIDLRPFLDAAFRETAPQPQGDRAALVERLSDIAQRAADADVFREAFGLTDEEIATLREAARAISAPGGAGARSSEGGGEEKSAPALNILGGAGGDRAALVERIAELFIEYARRALSAPSEATEPQDDETARCTCEWMSGENGHIHARWPAEVDPYCVVHVRPEAEREAYPDGFPPEFPAEATEPGGRQPSASADSAPPLNFCAGEAAETPLPESYACQRCGRRDGLDAVVPNDVWAMISPTGNEGGLLCLWCVDAACEAAGIECSATLHFAGRAITGTSQSDADREHVRRLCEQVDRLLVALHDAIRRPLGVVPDSAAEFYDPALSAPAEATKYPIAGTSGTFSPPLGGGVMHAHPDGSATMHDADKRCPECAEATKRGAEAPDRPPVHVSPRGVSYVDPDDLVQSQAFRAAIAPGTRQEEDRRRRKADPAARQQGAE